MLTMKEMMDSSLKCGDFPMVEVPLRKNKYAKPGITQGCGANNFQLWRTAKMSSHPIPEDHRKDLARRQQREAIHKGLGSYRQRVGQRQADQLNPVEFVATCIECGGSMKVQMDMLPSDLTKPPKKTHRGPIV